VKRTTIVTLFLVFVLCWRSHAAEDLLTDYFLPKVDVGGDETEKAIYHEFASYYIEIRKELDNNDFDSAFRLIDKYVIQKTEYLSQNVPKRERFYLSGFIGTALYIKALTLFQLNPADAIELFYYAYALVYEENRKISAEDNIDFEFSVIVGPILSQGTIQQALERFQLGVLPPSFIFFSQDVERRIQAPKETTDGLFTMVSAVVSEDFDEYMSIFQGFSYFKYLKPLERVLLITYNPKNRKALSYIKKLQKASGLRIRKKKDYSYDFFQMYARIDPEFAQRIFRKYYEKRS